MSVGLEEEDGNCPSQGLEGTCPYTDIIQTRQLVLGSWRAQGCSNVVTNYRGI